MSNRLTLITLLALFLLAEPLSAQLKFSRYLSDDPSAVVAPGSRKSKDKKPVTTEASGMPMFRAGAGFYTGFPLGDFNDKNYTGYGFHLDGEYFVMPDQLTVGLNTGFYGHRHDEIRMGVGKYTIIPIQARGVWYFLEDEFRPYGGLNAGLFLTRSKYDSIIEPRSYLDPVTQLYVHVPGGVKVIDNKDNVFGITPMIGLVYNIYERYWINLNARYTMMLTDPESTGSVGIHIGFLYSFDL